MAKREVIPTHEMHKLISNRFSAPAWATLHEVRNGTGYQRQTRTADAISLSLWPSRGIELHGFEVKASRADLRKELDDPEKARVIMQYCDRWWLVIGHKDLIQPGELPPTWGLLVAQKGRLVAKIEAPKLESKPLSALFVASLLRNYTESYVPKSDVVDMIETEVKRRLEADRDNNKHMLETVKREFETLRSRVETFEKASGIGIRYGWNLGRIGEAAGIIANSKVFEAKEQLERLKKSAEKIAQSVEDELAALKQAEENQ